MFRSLLTAAAFFAVGIGLAGCAAAAGATESASEDGRWEAEGPAFLILENGDLRGSDGCNGILGSYTVAARLVERHHRWRHHDRPRRRRSHDRYPHAQGLTAKA